MSVTAAEQRAEFNITTGPRRAAGFVALLVGLIGLLITLAAAGTSWNLNRNNEHRLLEVQTRQAGQVIASSVLSIVNPLTTALQVESATRSDPQQFARFMASYTGPGRQFVAASLWRQDGLGVRQLASIGPTPKLDPGSAAAHLFIDKALHSKTVVVMAIPTDQLQRIGYALGSPADPNVAVYAERAIPANRRVPVESSSAFSDLDFATYLGATTARSQLPTTDIAPNQLPFAGDTARIAIPFGDTVLTLVTSPRGQLGGAMGINLPWIFLGTGLLLTTVSALLIDRLARRRREVERLYGDLGDLYGQQRTIAETLQHALLPREIPAIPGVEFAVRYVPGAKGVDIGGDWYSVIAVDTTRFAFVVGDVSGRGLSAATIMAGLRYTIRAYALEGYSPTEILEKCANQLHVVVDGHFATVLVGLGDTATCEVTLANAGHFNPLVVDGTEADFVATQLGVPLGVQGGVYPSVVVPMAPGSTMIAFTDGLVERRTESLDVGLKRLAEAALSAQGSLDDLLTTLIRDLTSDASEDDIAILALRWRS